MNKYASLALAFLLVFSGCLGGSDELSIEEETIEPVGETDFTSLEKELENLTAKINAEQARLDTLETKVDGIDTSEDILKALGCEENEIARYTGEEWVCSEDLGYTLNSSEVWDIVSTEFEEVKDELEYAKNITDSMWNEIDYIKVMMDDRTEEFYEDMDNMSYTIYNHMDKLENLI